MVRESHSRKPKTSVFANGLWVFCFIGNPFISGRSLTCGKSPFNQPVGSVILAKLVAKTTVALGACTPLYEDVSSCVPASSDPVGHGIVDLYVLNHA